MDMKSGGLAMDNLAPLTPEVVMGGETGNLYRQTLADSFDDSRTWVDGSNKRLSDRIWSARQIDQQMISHTLKDGIVTGRSANEVAKELTRYYDPAFGGGNYAARRLARTEITRSLGAGTIDAQKRNPFSRGVKWALSGSHPRSDLCDPNAGEDQFKLGEGVYPATQVPRYPAHPNCLCTLIPVNDPRKDKVFEKILKDLDAQRAASRAPSPPRPNPRAASSQNRKDLAARRAARRQAATPEPVPVAAEPAPIPKPSIKERLSDPRWMPEDADIDEAIAIAKQQKDVALKSKDDFFNQHGSFNTWVQKDPEWIRLAGEIDNFGSINTYSDEVRWKQLIGDFEQRIRVNSDNWVSMAKSSYVDDIDLLADNINDVGQMMARRVNSKVGYGVDEFGNPSPFKSRLDNFRTDAISHHNNAATLSDASNELQWAQGGKRKEVMDFRANPLNDPIGTRNVQFYDDFHNAVDEELRRVRSFGNETLDFEKANSSTLSKIEHAWQKEKDIVKTVNEQVSRYPDDWVKALNSDSAPLNIRNKMPMNGDQGTYYTRHSTIKTSYEGFVGPNDVAGTLDIDDVRIIQFGGQPRNFSSTGIIRHEITHELGHAVDEVVPGLGDVNNSFFRKRIEPGMTGPNKGVAMIGDNPRWLDDFIEDYVGQDYGSLRYIYNEKAYSRNWAPPDIRGITKTLAGEHPGAFAPVPASTEITSTGMQSVLRSMDHRTMLSDPNARFQHGPVDIVADQDFLSHILGILAVI